MDDADNNFWHRHQCYLALWMLMELNEGYVSEHISTLNDVFENNACIEMPDAILSIIFGYTVQCVYDYRAILENRVKNRENGGKYMRDLISAYNNICENNKRLKRKNDKDDPPMNEDLMQWIQVNFESNLDIIAEMDRKKKEEKQREKVAMVMIMMDQMRTQI